MLRRPEHHGRSAAYRRNTQAKRREHSSRTANPGWRLAIGKRILARRIIVFVQPLCLGQELVTRSASRREVARVPGLIAKRIAPRECYWIGPPTWKPDTGIVAVIREHVAPCKFFDSSNMKLQRAGDGIHPTDKGGADWGDKFWEAFTSGTFPAAGASGPALLDAGK